MTTGERIKRLLPRYKPEKLSNQDGQLVFSLNSDRLFFLAKSNRHRNLSSHEAALILADLLGNSGIAVQFNVDTMSKAAGQYELYPSDEIITFSTGLTNFQKDSVNLPTGWWLVQTDGTNKGMTKLFVTWEPRRGE
ncbi:TPA: hypothetical protein DIV55_07250 [Patescibacteria group bacterium]|uniref:Uncharacterized protein n=1 Tax=Candidatus Gottesmanbacteria bacterium GW2011_GWA1_43_11 TaxID=1618436 RepID=A0A0G1CG58_9BACT|nr:MAG: hypothetical protein UV59_C0014G0023 [Candidatus Gottesmanbacteria bacterium GW2011_GWA1_43_11]HCS79498.1 hypothetical protein [Patescibacteria group bacterium]